MEDEEHPPFALMPKQCRRARELLGWTQAELGAASGVPTVELARFEAEVRGLDRATMGTISRALEEAGVDVGHGRARLREEPSAGEAILPGSIGRAS